MMFSICGSWSVPAAASGLGRSPGWSTLVDGLVTGAVVEDAVPPDVPDPDDDSDEEHAASPTAVEPASRPPSSALREKTGGDVTLRTVVTGRAGDNRSAGSVPAMEFADAVRRRHMTRNFRATPLDAELLEGLLAAALAAPSAGNTQGRDLVVLEGDDQTSRYWDTTTDAAWRASSRRFEGMSRAPVVVLAFSDPRAYVDRYAEPDKIRPDGVSVDWVVPYWHTDAAFAVMTLLLGASDQGLGAAFLGNFRGEDALKAELGVPDPMAWFGAVLLGEPELPDPPSPSAARPRRTVADSVHRGGW